MMNLQTSQKGHWFKCKNESCKLMVPLPDKIFIETQYLDAFEAECKCGYMSMFQWSDAGEETKKPDVDKYFGINEQRAYSFAYWTC